MKSRRSLEAALAMGKLSRRDLLRAGVAGSMVGAMTGLGASDVLAATSFAPGLALHPTPRLPLRPDRKTKHVVLIMMSGGVRSRETFGSPQQVPNLVQMANEGVL